MAISFITRRFRSSAPTGVALVSLILMGCLSSEPSAAAEGWLPTARMDNLRLEGNTAYVTFTDYAETENGYYITLFERDNRDRVVFHDFDSAGAVPGTRRQATRTVPGIPEGVALCATVRAYRWTGIEAPSPIVGFDSAARSSDMCADPASPPSDVALETIRGNATPRPGSAAYVLSLRNSGGTNSIGISVSVSTSGAATLGDQAPVVGSWSANGFSCATRPPSGSETSAMTCSGGQLKLGEQINPGVIVQLTPGQGAIHAQVSSRTTDTNSGNNGTALTLNVG
ncbi:hypothetical protein [Mycolicibacterium agri]|uniref:DUF11 domain-containing protein n=1 Tax=Mycolicibacterium agri TaxID=36811 RepID=A0A7I9W765_MYCAG|nr:hypothetical protein [Mycolicibacterium agri]GFG53420.1 hypothetical protein MAGR_48610 [Mycolicibacterium agri]